MSCTLYLVRHGIAEDASQEVSDEERALTSEGKRRMKEIARGLREIGARPGLILTSPLRRARETGEILQSVLAPDAALVICEPLANGYAAEDVVDSLPHGPAQEIALVGHQPSLGELASHLLTGSPGLIPLPFKKGGVAAVALPSVPPRSHGTLEWFLTPKQLRRMGG
jgi:phosphohistidine phosphatase